MGWKWSMRSEEKLEKKKVENRDIYNVCVVGVGEVHTGRIAFINPNGDPLRAMRQDYSLRTRNRPNRTTFAWHRTSINFGACSNHNGPTCCCCFTHGVQWWMYASPILFLFILSLYFSFWFLCSSSPNITTCLADVVHAWVVNACVSLFFLPLMSHISLTYSAHPPNITRRFVMGVSVCISPLKRVSLLFSYISRSHAFPLFCFCFTQRQWITYFPFSLISFKNLVYLLHTHPSYSPLKILNLYFPF